MTERKLVQNFVKFLQEKSIKKIKKEVLTKNLTKTDLVVVKNNISYSFEAKLNDIVKVWIQAFRNKSIYDFSFVVMPISKKNIFEKNEEYLSKFVNNDIGIILIGDERIEVLNKKDEFNRFIAEN